MDDIDRQFVHIYTTFYNRSYLFVKSYVHDDFAAEDIVSESLIKLWEAMQCGEVEKPVNLLFLILKNKSLNHLHREAMHCDMVDTLAKWQQRELEIRISTLQACNPEEIFSDEIKNIINKTLSSLPRRTRRIFEMSYYEQLSGKDIAKDQKISVKSVEYHITKSLKALRIALKDCISISIFFLHV